MRGCREHFVWQQMSGEKYNVGLFIQAGKGCSERADQGPKHVRYCPVRASEEWPRLRRGKAAKRRWAGGQGGCGQGREGKGEAGRLGCETGLASGSLGELQPASHVPCAPAFLSHGRENLVFFLSPWVNEASVHGGPAVKPLTTQMDTEWCAIDSYKLSVLILEREGWWLNTLSSFTWHLHAKVSCTWCLLVLENGIVTSVWHWA